MHYTFIYNPIAGRNRSERRQQQLERLLREVGLHHRIIFTEAPGHATEIAREAALSGHALVAVGGDGTVQEVAAGLVASGEKAHLGVIPSGTGNDFVKMIGMPHRLAAAVQALKEATPRPVDYGVVHCTESGAAHAHVFVNAVGVGIDAQVAAIVDGLKVFPGVTGYLAAVLKVLFQWNLPAASIFLRDGSGTLKSVHEGTFTLATSGNGISSGGGFLLTPGARIDDGQLDVCLADAITVPRALQIIPMILRGRHVGAPEIHIHRGSGVVITSTEGVPIHIDGEVIARKATRIEIDLVPGGLSVLAPASRFETS